MKTFKYLFFLAILSLWSCTKELPLPDTDSIPSIVVNGLIGNDDEVKVHVSESCHLSLTNCTGNIVEDATVNLLNGNGQLLNVMKYARDGIYTLDNYEIVVDAKYKLEVSTLNDRLAAVSAESYIPKKVVSRLIKAEEQVIENNLVWGFEIEIDDNPDEENYYILSGSFDIVGGEHGHFESEINGYVEPHFRHYSSDAFVENIQENTVADWVTYGLEYIFLPDTEFNGKTHRTTFGVADEDLIDWPDNEITGEVLVRSVSKQMYDYLLSVQTIRLKKADLFSEPQQVYSNIENGIGIFGGYAAQSSSIVLPKSEYYWPSNIFAENDGCTAACIVRFSSDGGSKLTHAWNFGDGNSGTGAEVEHTYEEPGLYQVNLNASRGDGNSWGASLTIEVK